MKDLDRNPRIPEGVSETKTPSLLHIGYSLRWKVISDHVENFHREFASSGLPYAFTDGLATFALLLPPICLF